MPVGGFTFEVQQVNGEQLGGGFVSQAFPRRGIIAAGDELYLSKGTLAQVGFARKEAAKPSVGVLDAALLPWAMRIAEVGVDAQDIAQFVMVGELCAVVLGQ